MFDLPPPDPGIEISVASRGISKGIAQSDGPQLIARALLGLGDLQVGGQWKNITSPVAKGEGAGFVTWQRKFGRVQTSLGATFKFQTGVEARTDDKALELNGSVAPKWGRFGARLSAVYSPNDFGSTGRSVYVEGGPSYDLTKTVRLSANVGRRDRVGSRDYTSFNAGISKTFGKLVLDGRYFDTAEGEHGEQYGARVVVSGRMSF